MIKKMAKEHISQVAEIEKICFSMPWSEKALEEEIDNETAKFLVFEEDEKVLAYIGMHLVCGEGYITNVAVFPEYRKQGIAQKLLLKAFEICEISVSLEVREKNKNAISLYEKLGFQKVGMRKNFYENPVENAVIYTKFKESI